MSQIGAFLATGRGKAIVAAVVVLVVVGQQLIARATAAPAAVELRTAAVSRGTVTQTVAVSGSVNASASYKLSFKTAGKITEILVAVGDQVTKDQPLARIDTSDLRTALATAQNNVDTAQARYDQIIAGADPRDVADAKRAWDKVGTSYATAKSTLQQNVLIVQNDMRSIPDKLIALRDQLVKIQYELSKVAQPFGTPIPPRTEQPVNTPEPTPNTAKADARTATTSMNQAQSSRDAAQATFDTLVADALGEFMSSYTNLQAAIAAFDSAYTQGSDATQAIAFVQTAQTTYANASSKLSSALETFGSQIGSVATSVSSANNTIQSGGSRFEPNLDQARLELATAQSMLTSLAQLLSGDKTRLAQASTSVATIGDSVSGTLLSSQSSYAKVTATPKPSDVLSALSSLQSAKTALQSAADNLDGATIRAPAAGTIATIPNQVGENVNANATVMTMANTNTLVLRGTIGEADVAKLRLSQVATITVDAVGASATSRMTGRLTSIDPVATIQQGVPVYGVEVTVDIPAAGVRAGMSGTANVIIASHVDVLTVPNLAVRSQGTRRFVQVVRNGVPVDADVTFGISNDTVTEVVSGLTDGDVVALPQPRSVTTARPQQFGGPGGGPVVIR